MGEWHGNGNSTSFSDEVNWDAVSHQQLWDWFSRARTESMSGAVQVWMNNVGSHFQAAADMVNEALRTAGVHWEGAAADSMRESTTPLASHALAAKDAATTVGETTLNQIFAATQMAYSIPEPKPAPQQQNLLSMVGSPAMVQHLVDVQEQERAASEAEARARDLARTYDAGADEAVSGLPRFEKAPQATVTRAEPGPTIEVSDPRPGGPGPGGGPGSGPGYTAGPGYTGPGYNSGPGYGTGVDPGGTSVSPQGGPGATSGQSWAPQTNVPAPTAGLPGTDAPRPTGTGPTPGLVGFGSPGGSTGGAPGRPGQLPGGGAAPGERVGAGGRALPGETVAARGSGTAARGAGMGMAPMGAARGKGEEDAERNSPEYLRAYNDEFWDDTPPVAPAVIGEDEDE